ncbi:MAG: 50S ribosomal protein L13 [Candidatus Woesearchaeota archaeon]|nr:50S ribosomal protein L13 [Candidatus Woesearchaeota archaeon]
MQIVIDATNLIAGRLGSYAAKQSLLGHTIVVLNAEKAIITGNKNAIEEEYWLQKRDLGQPQSGPFVSKRPDMFLRRMFRGMVPHKRPRGKEAYGRMMCYLGVPVQFKNTKSISLPFAHLAKLTTTKYLTIEAVCKTLGWTP